jgi:hypothetical protein
MLARQLADGLGIQRIGVIDRADAAHQRHAQGAGESERVEERQHAHHAVVGLDPQDLRDRLQV